MKRDHGLQLLDDYICCESFQMFPCRLPASLLKMSLFHRCFSNILLVKTNYLVYPSAENWSKIG